VLVIDLAVVFEVLPPFKCRFVEPGSRSAASGRCGCGAAAWSSSRRAASSARDVMLSLRKMLVRWVVAGRRVLCEGPRPADYESPYAVEASRAWSRSVTYRHVETLLL
jgi:hypothetical protein